MAYYVFCLGSSGHALERGFCTAAEAASTVRLGSATSSNMLVLESVPHFFDALMTIIINFYY